MATKPSLHCAVLLLAFHMSAALVVFETLMPMAARVALLMLIQLSLLYHLARDALLLFPDSWSEISLEQNRISVATRGGTRFSGPLTGKVTVSQYFALLGVRLEGRRLPVFRVIFPDALDADAYRELCVLLRFSRKLP